MKFCTTHWARLRKAIDDRGLSHLVAKDGATAAAQLRAEALGAPDSQGFDPLMRVHNMIASRALQQGGAYLLHGEYCPLCELVKHTPVAEVDQEWIDGASDSVLQYCRELKIVQEH